MKEMRIITKVCIVVFAFCFFIFDNVNGDQNGELRAEIYHSILDPEIFSFRANVTIFNLYSDKPLVFEQDITDSQENSGNHKFYRMKFIVYYRNVRNIFYSSTKACGINSKLSDIIKISSENSSINSFATYSVSSIKTCRKPIKVTLKLKSVNTKVYVKNQELAPVPDTLSFIQKLERDREAREKGEGHDNRGVFAKYWMYIVPVVVLIFISGASNQEGAK